MDMDTFSFSENGSFETDPLCQKGMQILCALILHRV